MAVQAASERHLMVITAECIGNAFTDVIGPSTAPPDMFASFESQCLYGNPDQTVIIFDWDDTLCPTTWLKSHEDADPQMPKLKMFCERTRALLTLAGTLGKVVIVTNAKRPWVEHCCRTYFPSLLEIVKEDIPVFYALENIKFPNHTVRSDVKKALLTQSKAQAMLNVVIDFYSRYPNQSWKNLLIIGDEQYEHDAIHQVLLQRPQMEKKPCRCKTVKHIKGLPLSLMIPECAILQCILPELVRCDGDVHIDIASHKLLLKEWWTKQKDMASDRSRPTLSGPAHPPTQSIVV